MTSPPLSFDINGSLDLSEWVDAYIRNDLDEELRPILVDWLRVHAMDYMLDRMGERKEVK